MKRFVRLPIALTTALVLIGGGVSSPAAGETAGGAVHGTITGPDGAMLGAQDAVKVELRHPYWNSVVGVGVVDPATGSYAISDITPGEYAVKILYTGTGGLVSEWAGDTYVFDERQVVAVADGDVVDVSASLARGARITGVVTGGGVAQSDSRVELESVDGFDPYLNDHRLAWTSATGAYATSWVPAGEYTVTYTARTSGWKVQNHNGVSLTGPGVTSGPPLALTAGTLVRDVALEPWASISGTVMLRTGDTTSPVSANINIHVQDAYGQWVWSGSNFWTRPDGTFTIPDLRGRGYRLEFESSGAISEFWQDAPTVGEARTITVGEGEAATGIDVELDAVATIRATVAVRPGAGDATEPLAQGEVALWRFDEASAVYAPVESPRSLSGGQYYSPSLSPGTYAIQFRADPSSGMGSEYYDDARYFSERTDIIVEAGDDIDLGTVVLEPRYFDIDRLAGPDRFGTAVEITRALFADAASPEVLYLTNAYNYPDALAAGPAAIHQGGAILPVAQGYAPAVILDEIERLQPRRIVVLGQENAVSKVVVDQVDARLPASVPIARIGEADRYSTAAAVVRAAFPEGSRYAFIVTGRNYPDALAAGAAAGHLGAPVILVPGSGSDLPTATAALLADLGATDVLIAGGPTTVSPGIELDLEGLPGVATVERFAGVDRYQTAAMINQAVFDGSEFALLASGTGFADALAGSPLAGALDAPLYLTPQHCVPDDPYYQLWDQDVQGVTLLGGLPTLGVGVEELAAC